MIEPRYTIVIQWSEEDQKYVVSLPEWGSGCKTHGDSYEEAARNAKEVLQLLIETRSRTHSPDLPKPRLFSFPGVVEVLNGVDEIAMEPAPADGR